ncbi:unnamed protein product [Gongylonema pulchrum]|uniref:Zinc finger protein n=1 Tax=Gongylonema pulchrum TaxID=637853 RepID=A0A183EJJ4_9BILA|nr:unnamed protein product [Gongylonema pulchrum]
MSENLQFVQSLSGGESRNNLLGEMFEVCTKQDEPVVSSTSSPPSIENPADIPLLVANATLQNAAEEEVESEVNDVEMKTDASTQTDLDEGFKAPSSCTSLCKSPSHVSGLSARH